MRDFRKYAVWNLAMELATDIYDYTANFPKEEKYGLAGQIQRAAVSISSNIAEGASRKSEVEFIHFLEIALGSAFELETQLIIANRVGYIAELDVTQLLERLHAIQKGVNHLVSVIRKEPMANGQWLKAQ